MANLILDVMWNGVGNVTGINDAIDSIMSGIMAVIILPSLVYGILNCLFGYKIFRIMLVIIGFLCGCVPILVVGGIIGGSEPAALMSFVIGFAFAYLAHKLYKLGVFISVTFTSSFAILISLITLMKFINSGLITLSVILGIIIGIIAVILDKAIIIIYTAISGAFVAANALAAITISELFILYAILLSFLGIWFQNKSENNALGFQNVQETNTTTEPKTTQQNLSDSRNENTSVNRYIENINENIKELAINATSMGYKVLVSDTTIRWTESMPILVKETQIASTKDNQIIFNMLVQNISTQQITSIYIDIKCYNPLKQQLESVNNKAVLDLHINSGETWSSKNLVVLPNNTTRKCIVTIRNIVFNNEDIWTNEKLQEIQAIDICNNPEPLNLTDNLADEFYNHLMEKTNINSARIIYTYKPLNTDKYWYCACGQFNISDNCVKCGLSKEIIFDAYDVEKLKLRINERNIAITKKKEIAKKQREKMISDAKQKSKAVINGTKLAFNTFIERTKLIYTDIYDKAQNNPQKAIICGSVSVASIIVIALLIAGFTNETNRFNSAVKKNDYASAIEIYNKSDDTQKLNEIVEEKVDNIYNNFKKGNIKFEQAESDIKEIYNYFGNQVSRLDEIYSNICILNNSIKSFEDGMNYLDDKNYEMAIQSFSAVSELDSNYEKAQSKLKEAQDDYIKSVKSNVDLLMQNKDYSASFELITTAKAVVIDDIQSLNELEASIINQQENERIQAEIEAHNRPYQMAIDYIENKVDISNSLSSKAGRTASGNEMIDARIFKSEDGKQYLLTVWSDNHQILFTTHTVSTEYGFTEIQNGSFVGAMSAGIDNMGNLLTITISQIGITNVYSIYSSSYDSDMNFLYFFETDFPHDGEPIKYYIQDTEVSGQLFGERLNSYSQYTDVNITHQYSSDAFEYYVDINTQKSVEDTLTYLQNQMK